jgi:hypothetical protein
MKILKVKIKNMTHVPLNMHNSRTADPLDFYAKKLALITSKGRKRTLEDIEHAEELQFQAALYYEPEDKEQNKPARYIMPAMNIESCLINGGKLFRQGPTMQRGVTVPEDAEFIFPNKHLKPEELYQIKSHVYRVITKAQNNRIVTVKPQFPEWELTFTLYVDTEVISVDDVKNIIEKAGQYKGIGTNRPRFGRFDVVYVKEVKMKKAA